MNNYTWKIEALDCIPSVDGQTNVVSTIHWRLNATDGVNFIEHYNAVLLDYNAEAPFVEYADLTEETVVEWLKQALGEEQIEAILSSIDDRLEALANPPIVSPKLPWSN